MKITSAKITPVAFPDPPLLSAFGLHDPVALRAVLEVTTDDGLLGLGESYGDDVYLDGLRAAAATLPGADPFDLTDLKRRISTVVTTRRVAGTVPMLGSSRMFRVVYGAYEVACLDLQGQQIGRPIGDLLGGVVRPRVPCSAYLFYRLASHPGGIEDGWGAAVDADSIVAQARRMVDQYGFSALKLKGGVLRPRQEIETIEALHHEFPTLPLRIDPNASWDVPTAMHVAATLAGKLQYLEDPVAGIPAMAQVAAATPIPMATNMCTVSFDDIPESISQKAIGVILADHHFWGGLRASTQLAAMCQTFGIGVSMHSNSHLGISLAAMGHLAGAIDNLDYEIDTHWPWKPSECDVVTNPPTIGEGFLTVPTGPGLGVDLDRDALAAMHQHYLTVGVHHTDQRAYFDSVSPSLVDFVYSTHRGPLRHGRR